MRRRLEVGNLPLSSLPPCRTQGFGDRQRLSTPKTFGGESGVTVEAEAEDVP